MGGRWFATEEIRGSGGENRKSELEEGKDRHRDMLWVMSKVWGKCFQNIYSNPLDRTNTVSARLDGFGVEVAWTNSS